MSLRSSSGPPKSELRDYLATDGNVSSVISDTIELDTTAATDCGLTINDDALFINEVTVTFTIGVQPGTAQMQISNEGNSAGLDNAIHQALMQGGQV